MSWRASIGASAIALAAGVANEDPAPDTTGAPPPGEENGGVDANDGEGRVCMLIVDAQGTDPLPAEGDIQRFLHSFKPA